MLYKKSLPNNNKRPLPIICKDNVTVFGVIRPKTK